MRHFVSEIARAPVATGDVDFFSSRATLEHFLDFEAAMSRMYSLTATGGAPPYTWSITGSLPGGLGLDSATGQISGTPDTAGASNFTAQVADSMAGSARGTGLRLETNTPARS